MLYVTTSRDGETIALHIVCPVCNCGIRITDGALPKAHDVPMEFVLAVRERLEKECKHIATYGGHYGNGTHAATPPMPPPDLPPTHLGLDFGP